MDNKTHKFNCPISQLRILLVKNTSKIHNNNLYYVKITLLTFPSSLALCHYDIKTNKPVITSAILKVDIITGLSFDKDSWIVEESFQPHTPLSFCVWRCKSNKVSHKRKLLPGCINWKIDIAKKY
jgi:hypothetical protein